MAGLEYENSKAILVTFLKKYKYLQVGTVGAVDEGSIVVQKSEITNMYDAVNGYKTLCGFGLKQWEY